jgi:hypothetical protein
MLKKINISTIVLWSARIMTAAILVFLLFMVGSQVVGVNEAGTGFQSTKEMAMFICFPITTCLGLVIAFKYEGIGGLIATLSLLGIGIMDSDLISAPSFFIVFGVPGLLNILYWLLNRNK